MSSIRGKPLTQDFGSHLAICPPSGGIPNWPDVQDEQIPTSLQVSQNPNQVGMDLDWCRIWLGVMGVIVVRAGLAAMVDDPVDLCFI
jgi:hypothetical protein